MTSYEWPSEADGSGAGVTSLNSLTGDLNITAGAGITVTPSGSDIVIASVAGTAITSINADNTAAQLLTVGSAGTDFAIVDAGSGSHVFNLPTASASNRGALSSTDWSTFNSKQAAGDYLTAVSVASANGLAGTSSGGTTPALTLSTSITGILQGNGTAISAATIGSLTDAGTDGITITGGSNSVLGSGTSLAQHVADATHNGYLSSTDWNTFNGKGAGTVTSVAMTLPSSVFTTPPTGSPITTSGTFAIALATQTAGTFFCGPQSGSAAVPTFKALQVPQVTTYLSGSNTYTVPAGALWLEFLVQGAGGGGGGGSTANTTGGTPATAGTASTVGSTIFVANGGAAASASAFGAGGSYSIAGAGVDLGESVAGGNGACGAGTSTGTSNFVQGGMGGNGLGGAGNPKFEDNGQNAQANSGSGGGGGSGAISGTNSFSGAGGGGGAKIHGAILGSLSATYTCVVGAKGTGEVNTVTNGGNAGDGKITVTAHFQ